MFRTPPGPGRNGLFRPISARCQGPLRRPCGPLRGRLCGAFQAPAYMGPLGRVEVSGGFCGRFRASSRRGRCAAFGLALGALVRRFMGMRGLRPRAFFGVWAAGSWSPFGQSVRGPSRPRVAACSAAASAPKPWALPCGKGAVWPMGVFLACPVAPGEGPGWAVGVVCLCVRTSARGRLVRHCARPEDGPCGRHAGRAPFWILTPGPVGPRGMSSARDRSGVSVGVRACSAASGGPRGRDFGPPWAGL